MGCDMRLYPECVPCMLKQALEMAKLVTHDRKVLERVLRAGLGILQSERWNVPQPIVAFKLFRKVSELIGVEDPYREIKRQSNRFVMNLYDELEGIIESSKDKLMTAIKLSIAGNIIDYGTGRPFDVDETINRVLRTDFTINHYKLLREDIEKAETIVIFGDNAGEAVFDKLLIEQLGDKKITYFVRAHPFINDVTVIDAEEISLEDIAEIKEVRFGDWDRGMSIDEAVRFAKKSDLIISKGQGNFELLSGYDAKIYFLFIVKCDVIARAVNAPIGSQILLLNQKYR